MGSRADEASERHFEELGDPTSSWVWFLISCVGLLLLGSGILMYGSELLFGLVGMVGLVLLIVGIMTTIGGLANIPSSFFEMRDYKRRYQIFLSIEKFAAAGDVESLATLVRSAGERVVRKKVGEELGKLDNAYSVELLTEMIKHGDDYVRSGAGMALRQIKDSRAIDPLIEALQDNHEEVRDGAMAALGNFREERVVRVLLQVLEDEHENKTMRRSAGYALVRLAGYAPENIDDSLRFLSEERRQRVMGALDEMDIIKPPRAGQDVIRLIEMLKSRDARNAAIALEKIDDARVVDLLMEFLERRSEFMETAMNRYRDLWENNPAMNYRDWARADYQWIQFSAIRIFEKFGGASATAYLEKMVDDLDLDIETSARRALQRLQGQQ